MIVTTRSRMSLEEYLTYDDGTDARYELVDGVLAPMGAESTLNTWIAMYLAFAFGKLGVSPQRCGMKQKIQVSSPSVSAREPDLVIHSGESALALKGRSEACLRLNEPNPLILIEVVSPGEPGTENYDRDYVDKRAEYAARGIPEYWLIDPARSLLLVLTLSGGAYQAVSYRGDDVVVSPRFPDLKLTAAQILNAGE